MSAESLAPLSPVAARDLLPAGAWLVDVRDADEHARERIPGARPLPLDQITAEALAAAAGAPGIIFHCRTGVRTAAQASRLAACAPCAAYVLDGGLEAWVRAGLPRVVDTHQPLPMMRQVQIAAGSLVVAGALLGFAISPWFHALSAAMGIGLVFAGVSGVCGMARLLSRMPWNR